MLFNTVLYKSVFSTYSFKKLFFHLSVFYLFCLYCFEFDVIFVDFLGTGGWKESKVNDKLLEKTMSSTYHMEQKTFIEASCTNSMHTGK